MSKRSPERLCLQGFMTDKWQVGQCPRWDDEPSQISRHKGISQNTGFPGLAPRNLQANWDALYSWGLGQLISNSLSHCYVPQKYVFLSQHSGDIQYPQRHSINGWVPFHSWWHWWSDLALRSLLHHPAQSVQWKHKKFHGADSFKGKVRKDVTLCPLRAVASCLWNVVCTASRSSTTLTLQVYSWWCSKQQATETGAETNLNNNEKIIKHIIIRSSAVIGHNMKSCKTISFQSFIFLCPL